MKVNERAEIVKNLVLTKLALCYISFNSTLHEPLLNMSVSSVRNQGNWRGPIYVITDEPRCVPKSTKAILVDLDGCYKNMAYKYFKTRILDLVPSDYILYLDTDIFVAQPIVGIASMAAVANLAGIMGTVEKSNFVGVTQDVHLIHNKFLRWHGGIALVSRERSARCLQQWRHGFHKCTRDGDQIALRKAIESRKCIFTDMDPIFSLPTHENIKMKQFAIFNHFTRTGRLKLKHGLSEDDLNKAGRLIFGPSLPNDWWLQRDDSCLLHPQQIKREPKFVLPIETCLHLPPQNHSIIPTPKIFSIDEHHHQRQSLNTTTTPDPQYAPQHKTGISLSNH